MSLTSFLLRNLSVLVHRHNFFIVFSIKSQLDIKISAYDVIYLAPIRETEEMVSPIPTNVKGFSTMIVGTAIML